MIVKFNKRPIRSAGKYKVKIISIEKLFRNDKQLYQLKLENETNYIIAKIYTSKSYVILDIIFNILSLKRNIFDENLKELIGKELMIKVVENTIVEANNFGLIKQFYDVKEYRPLNYDWNEQSYFERSEDDSASLEEVFGIDREELARAMGKDPSDVSDGDYWDYAGY